MPLPPGFKVNGQSDNNLPVPPQVQKMIAFLDACEPMELFSTQELANRLRLSVGGNKFQSPALADYRELVDSKMFWGSRLSIEQLRKQLHEANQ